MKVAGGRTGRSLLVHPSPLKESSLREARPVLAYVAQAGIKDDREGLLFRPLRPDGLGLARRHLDRKTPWRLVKGFR
jgi:hypothetical protein